MANFKDTYRLEKVYYENMWTLLNMLKSIDSDKVDMDTVKELLRNAIADNESIIIIYKNLGELYNEIAERYGALNDKLKELQEDLDQWKDDINEKIDELNNYIMELIREIETRLDAIEADLATMQRNIFVDLVYDSVNDSYSLERNGNTLTFDEVKELADFPHNVIVKDDDGNVYFLQNNGDDLITWQVDGLNADSEYNEGVISITDDDTVSYEVKELVIPEYTAGTGIDITDYVVSVDTDVIQEKLTEGTGIDIDSNNVISVDTDVIQEKLTEGTGIDIDSNNEISVDTDVIQEKLTAGTNIQIDSQNVISATDTVYSAGTGIDIDSSNVISADFDEVQAKLTAGSGISIDPDTNEISNTAQGEILTAGIGIYKTPSNRIISRNTFPSFSNKKGNYSIPNALVTLVNDQSINSIGRLFYKEGSGLFDVPNHLAPDVAGFGMMQKPTYYDYEVRNGVQLKAGSSGLDGYNYEIHYKMYIEGYSGNVETPLFLGFDWRFDVGCKNNSFDVLNTIEKNDIFLFGNGRPYYAKSRIEVVTNHPNFTGTLFAYLLTLLNSRYATYDDNLDHAYLQPSLAIFKYNAT